MEKKIMITCDGLSDNEVIVGTTLKEISEKVKDNFKYDILLAKIDNDLAELTDTVTRNCDVEFYDRSSTLGRYIYISSATFMLIVAVKNVLGPDAKVITKHSLDNGVLCQIEGVDINRTILNQINEEMHRLAKENLLFEKISVSRTDAIKYFKNKKQLDKVNVLKYISNTYVNLYKLDNCYNYFYSKLAYSTGQIDEFETNYLYANDFVLSVPTLSKPNKMTEYSHHTKVVDAFNRAEEFTSKLGCEYAADVNRVVSNAKITDLILLAESYYESQLQRTADDISSKRDVRLVLLAGPSSSGKTTTSKKIMNYLKSNGHGVLQISVDNYFKELKDTPKDENGDYDFECIEAVDTELLNKHLVDLLAGKEVEFPTYNFLTGKREYNGNKAKLGANEIMVIEGIHAINDQMTFSIDKKLKYKIYISPLVNIGIDSQNYIHTTDIRKLRRIVRDSKTRGKTASATLKMWHSIRKGEEKYIYPYQDDVDTVINSNLCYEIGVLKTYVEPLLFCVDENDNVYPEALRLINFLRNFLPIPSDDIPVNSVLREFIGGSCYKD